MGVWVGEADPWSLFDTGVVLTSVFLLIFGSNGNGWIKQANHPPCALSLSPLLHAPSESVLPQNNHPTHNKFQRNQDCVEPSLSFPHFPHSCSIPLSSLPLRPVFTDYPQ